MGTIYQIKHKLSDRCYVGKTERTLTERWNEHITAARHKPKTLIGRAIAKHGFDAFEFKLLEEVADAVVLNEREQWWIAELNTNACKGGHGFNMTDGGEGTRGHVASEETRAKLRKRVFSSETRKKMRESAKRRRKPTRSASYVLRSQKSHPASNARQRPDSRRAQTSKLSHKTRDKISQSLIGHVVDEQTRMKIALTQASRGQPVEACCPITGAIRSFEHCNDATWQLRNETGNAKIYAGNIRRACKTGGLAYGYRWRYTQGTITAPQ